MYEAPDTRSKMNDEVREELAGRENNRSDCCRIKI